MVVNEKPVIRKLQAVPFDENGARMVSLNANDGLSDLNVSVSLPAFYLITMMDGSRDVEGIRAEFYAQFQHKVDSADVEKLIHQLDEALLLDNQRYREAVVEASSRFIDAPVRPAAFAGKSYPEEKSALSAMIEKELAGHEPGDEAESIIVPHIDFRVGASMMARGWSHLPTSPDHIVVILGTGHYLSDDFFACIDKDFSTPIGLMEVDKEFMSALGKNFGEDIYKNAISHKMEHSIEFQALFMAARAANGCKQKAAPILLSFPEDIRNIDHPVFNGKRLDRFIAAIAKAVEECGKKALFVASVDFAHVGVRFGDEDPLTKARLEKIEQDDMVLIEKLENVDYVGFLKKIQSVNPTNRICGFPPLDVLLKLTNSKSGKVLEYNQNLENEMENVVSFATIALA